LALHSFKPLTRHIGGRYKGLGENPYGGHSAVARKVKRDWQRVDDVLGLFGKRKSDACKAYVRFVKNGVLQGRRLELTGIGLVHSAVEWAALSALEDEDVQLKGDKRILFDSHFVKTVLNPDSAEVI
jgi:hypothetical protein